MLTFLKSVKKEMQLVTWPTYRQNCYSVGLVIVFSIFFVGFLVMMCRKPPRFNAGI